MIIMIIIIIVMIIIIDGMIEPFPRAPPTILQLENVLVPHPPPLPLFQRPGTAAGRLSSSAAAAAATAAAVTGDDSGDMSAVAAAGGGGGFQAEEGAERGGTLPVQVLLHKQR
jgi:hypothetical protein